ncbi:MAG: hypothetical protein V3W18_02730 [candidate division Zixibacteria bacterium]
MMNKREIKVLATVILLLFGCLQAFADELIIESGMLRGELSGQQVFQIKGSKNLAGEIRIVSRQTEDIVISFEKTARTSSKSESTRFLDLIDIKLDIRDDRATLIILSPSQAPWEGSDYGVSLEVLVNLPEKMKIIGEINFMKFVVEGPFQGIDLESTHSALDIRRIYGSVTASTTHGDVTLHVIKGEIDIETQNGGILATDIIVPSGYALFQTTDGAIKLTDIQGPVEAYTTHSSIEVKGIDAPDGSVVLRTSYGELTVYDITGELICETSYEPINITKADINHGHSKIETSHAPIFVDFLEISNSHVYISTEYSNVNLNCPADLSAKIIAGVESGGRIHTRDLNLIPTVLNRTRLEAVAGDGESRIEVNIGGIGDITILGQ